MAEKWPDCFHNDKTGCKGSHCWCKIAAGTGKVALVFPGGALKYPEPNSDRGAVISNFKPKERKRV